MARGLYLRSDVYVAFFILRRHQLSNLQLLYDNLTISTSDFTWKLQQRGNCIRQLHIIHFRQRMISNYSTSTFAKIQRALINDINCTFVMCEKNEADAE